MKFKLSFILITLFVIAACHSKKKSTSTTSTATKSTTTSTTSTVTASTPSVAVSAAAKPANGIYPPGDEELTAVQATYKTATIQQLKDGHELYTKTACIQCHDAKNIYKRDTFQWRGIIDDMAKRANISDAQKDAVYLYVMAIKAAQPK